MIVLILLAAFIIFMGWLIDNAGVSYNPSDCDEYEDRNTIKCNLNTY